MLFKHIPKLVINTLIAIAAIGFVDATYLTINHFQNGTPPCFVGSCEVVLTSAYSVMFGIPTALYGALYYLFILICLGVYIESHHVVTKQKSLTLVLATTVIGMGMSIYFFCIQAFVLHAFCQYCLVSAVTSTLLFIISVFVVVKYRLPRDLKS